MITSAGIGWWNAGAPLALLAALAIGLPPLIVPRATRSQTRLAGGVAITAVLLLLIGAALIGLLSAFAGNPVAVRLAAHPLTETGALVARSAPMAILWAPVLALAWLVMAQGVEKRRGEDRIRADGTQGD